MTSDSGIKLSDGLSPRPSLANMFGHKSRQPTCTITPMYAPGSLDTTMNTVLVDMICTVTLPRTHRNVRLGGCEASVLLYNCDHHLKSDFIAAQLQKCVKKKADVHYASLAAGDRSRCRLTSADQWNIVKKALERVLIVQIFSPLQFEVSLISLKRILVGNHNISLVLINSINTFYSQVKLTSGIYHTAYLRRLLLPLLKSVESFSENLRIIYTELNLFNQDDQTNDFNRAGDKLAVIKERIRIEMLDAPGTYNIVYT